MKQIAYLILLASCSGALFANTPATVEGAATQEDEPVTPAEAEGGATAEPAVLERVEVTAQRRREALQDIPLSVTALGEEELSSRNVTSVSRLQVAVPNVIIGNPLGQGTIMAYIRGIGTANPVFSQDPAVGIYVDDVYLARSLGANMDLFDVSHVEVLRGPQGTLYGANSPAGAIRIVTAKPYLGEGFGLTAQAVVGSHNERGLNLAANVPIINEQMAARLVLQSGSHDGYQTNLADGSNLGSRDFTNIRLHLLTRLSDQWELLLTGNDFDNRVRPIMGVNFRGPGGIDLFTTPGFNRRDTFSEMKALYDDVQSQGLTADLTGRIGAADFRSITAFRNLDFQINQDVDGRTVDTFSNSQFLENQTYTQEFNLSGERGPLHWLVGAYLIQEKTDFAWHVRVMGSVVNPPLGVAPSFQVFDQTKDSWSIYTQQTWSATDRLALTGGFRWTEETKDFHVRGFTPSAIVDRGMPPGTPIPGFDIQQARSWSAPQWRFAADYRVTEDAMVFASATRGFRSGGFHGGARSIAEARAAPFNPEYVTTYEAGARTEWLARRLRLNLTYFRNEYKDQQVALLATGGVFSTVTMDSNMHGWELESVWLPTAGLRVFANAGTFRGSSDSAFPVIPNAEWQYSLGFDYSRSAGANRYWFVGANYFRTAGYDVSLVLDPLRRVPSYGDLGARVGLASEDGKWKVELVGSNLNDDYWPTFSFNIPPLTSIRFPNAPRLVSLKLTLTH